MQCVVAWCSVMQRAAACCRVLQCGAACCSVLQFAAVCCSVSVHCNVLQCVAVKYSMLWTQMVFFHNNSTSTMSCSVFVAINKSDECSHIRGMYTQASMTQTLICNEKHGNIAARILAAQQHGQSSCADKNIESTAAYEILMGRIRVNQQVVSLFEGLLLSPTGLQKKTKAQARVSHSRFCIRCTF